VKRGPALVPALASMALSTLLRAPNLPQPTGPDQGIMMRIGLGILRGHVPYRDAFEAATPPIFFTYAGFLAVLGETMRSVNLADLIVVSLTSALVAFIGSRACPERPRGAAWAAGLLYAVVSAGTAFGMNAAGELTAGSYWFVAQREVFIGFLVAAATALAFGTGVPGAARAAAIGLLTGAGFMYKFPALLLFLPATAYVLLPSPEGAAARHGVFRRAMLWAGGVAAAPALCLVWFWRHEALAPMYEATVEFVRQVYGQNDYGLVSALKNGFLRTGIVVRESAPVWALALAGAATVITGARRSGAVIPASRRKQVVVLWFAASVLVVAAQREFFGYHYLVIPAPLAATAGMTAAMLAASLGLGAGIGLRRTVAALGRMPAVLVLLAAGACGMVVFAGYNLRHVTRFVRFETGERDRTWYDSHFTAWPEHEYSYPGDAAVAAALAEITKPDDRVFVLGGIEPVIYTLADRRSASRFIWSWCLTDTNRADLPIAGLFREELIRDFSQSPPAALVTIGPLERFSKYPILTDALLPAYEQVGVFPDERYLYRLKPGARIAAPRLPVRTAVSGSDPW